MGNIKTKITAIVVSLLITLTVVVNSVTAAPTKWHPGHYVMLVGDGKYSDRYMSQVYNEMDSHSALRGVAIRYKWSELEKSKGIYDFSSIDKHLAALKLKNKQLIILLEYKSFKPEVLVPNYLRTAAYEQGIFALGSGSTIKGYNIKLWNIAVKDRLSALIAALAEHVNSHPNFEAFGLQESTMGQPLIPLTTTQVSGFYNNLLLVDRHARLKFTNTNLFQLTNYPRTFLQPLVNELVNIGGTLGATDIFLQEAGLFHPGSKYTSKGLYLFFPDMNGKIPLLAQVEKTNYENTKHDGSGYKPTVNELLVFGRDKLFANYILWTRSPGYYTDVLLMLNQKTQTSTPSGGLISICPLTLTCSN